LLVAPLPLVVSLLLVSVVLPLLEPLAQVLQQVPLVPV
jgi:hypothetical protein